MMLWLRSHSQKSPKYSKIRRDSPCLELLRGIALGFDYLNHCILGPCSTPANFKIGLTQFDRARNVGNHFW